MATKWFESLTGSLEQKKQYKQDMARLNALPAPYAETALAFNRYFLYYGAVSDSATLLTMLGDHADLWEAAVADGTPISSIVGNDPVGFAEVFVAAYQHKEWIEKERNRLVRTVDTAIGKEHQS